MSGGGGGGGSGSGSGFPRPRFPRPLKDEDNPFMRQLQLMLDKSASNRAAARSPSLPRATASAAPASSWRPTALSSGCSGAGGVGYRDGKASQAQHHPSLSAAPKKASAAASGGVDLDEGTTSPPLKPPRSIFDLLDDSSSDDGNMLSLRFLTTASSSSSPPPPPKRPPASSMAEAKPSRSSGSGGWPETKRCSPPNLKPSPPSKGERAEGLGSQPTPVGGGEVAAGGYGDGGDGGGGGGLVSGRGGGGGNHGSKEKRKGSPPYSPHSGNGIAPDAGTGKNPSITGGRSFGGAGITGSRPQEEYSSGSESSSCGGRGFGSVGRVASSRAGAPAPGAIFHNRSAAAAGAGVDDELMSDKEDHGGLPHAILSSVVARTAAAAAAAGATGNPIAGLKRGRSPPIAGGQSSGHGSDGSSSGDGRGRKAGRWGERYGAPAPARRERRNSLSLSPPRLLSCNGDYVTSDEDEEEAASTTAERGRTGAPTAGRKVTPGNGLGGGGGGRRGSKKELSLSSPATARHRRSGGAGDQDGGSGRGRKRGQEDLLNDRIEALRVGSDGEGPQGNGAAAIRARKRRGLAAPMGEEEDGDFDDEPESEDRKPHFEDPTWLGKLEPFDLGGGGFINPSINRYLRDYQREGVRWLYNKFKAGQGGILGDDMGLGKTVQSVTLLSAVLQKTGTRRDNMELQRRRKAGLHASATGLPWLIVAPASVVRVWIDHLKLWGFFSAYQLVSGRDVDISAGVREGTGRDWTGGMGDMMAGLSAGRYEVIATSYDLLRACVDYLKKQHFDAVLFDEYHTIKSASARVSQAACELKTKRVFGLTGTLIQNDMKELWFLLHLIDPLAVGEQSRFTEHFSEPIKRARAMNATASDRRLGEKRLKELDAIRDRNMIRRTKDEELGDVLKGKSDTVVFCELSEVQRDLYKQVLSLPEFQLLTRAKEPCDCGRGGNPTRAKCCYRVPVDEDEADGIDPRAVLFRKFHPSLQECDKCPFCSQLAAVSKLQKIANHPCLLQQNGRDSEQQRRHQRQFAEVAFTERARETMGGLERSQRFLDVAKVGVCGKMKSLETLLAKFHETRDKVLVFSWSTTMLDVLESFVGAKGYQYRRLDGTTSHKERQARIKEFNSDKAGVFVFLISTRAGGQGLNLYTASRVILYDVNWNPALELQAQDRAYRIGQKNKVSVFRLISKGTIEEMCYMRQIYKLQITSAAMGDQARGGRRQFNAVQGSKGQEGELFGIQNLLKFSDFSLLKELRQKHEAGLAAAAGGGAVASAAAVDVAGGKGGGSGGDKLGVPGVDTVNEVDLMIAMKNALGRVKKELEAGGAGPPEDSELAGLLGVLGVDAYTHDQLVAKDEGEEELEEESCSIAELSLSPLPNGGSRNAMEETVVKPRGAGGGGDNVTRSTAADRKGTARPISRGVAVVGAGDVGGGVDRRGKGLNGVAPVAAAVCVEQKAGQPPTPQKKQQEPAKKRRNLSWGQRGAEAAGGGSTGGGGARVELFLPQYGSGSGSGGGS